MSPISDRGLKGTPLRFSLGEPFGGDVFISQCETSSRFVSPGGSAFRRRTEPRVMEAVFQLEKRRWTALQGLGGDASFPCLGPARVSSKRAPCLKCVVIVLRLHAKPSFLSPGQNKCSAMRYPALGDIGTCIILPCKEAQGKTRRRVDGRRRGEKDRGRYERQRASDSDYEFNFIVRFTG